MKISPVKRSTSTALLPSWVIVAAFVLSIGTALAQTSYIYVESNKGKTANKNSVLAFSNDGLGNLTPLSGSPYLTTGTGVFDTGGGPTDPFNADQQVIARKDGSLLYAVNGGSNTIAAFTINADGTLTTVPGSPFPSGGQDPASVGLMDDSGFLFLVAVNKNEDPAQNIGGDVPNYTTFTVNTDGSLTMNPGSTLDLPADSSPTQALIRSGVHLLFGMEDTTSRLVTYRIKKDGTLSQLASVPPPVTDFFLGEILYPKAKTRILYAGLPITNQVAVYRFDALGNLTFVRTVASPNGAAICWLVTNAAGTLLFTAETESGTITDYDITDHENPVLLQQLTLSGTGDDMKPHNIALDPTETFLYAVAGIKLHVLDIAIDGTMSETRSPITLPVASDETPVGLAVVRK